jgi:hypothetical protein
LHNRVGAELAFKIAMTGQFDEDIFKNHACSATKENIFQAVVSDHQRQLNRSRIILE